MNIIATIPPPHNANAYYVAKHPLICSARFNTGSHDNSPYSPYENLQQLSRLMGYKPLFVDLKGWQLRVDAWSDPIHGVIELNREIEVDLPAQLWLRGEKKPLTIVKIKGKKVYTDSNPAYGTGKGQAANVLGNDFRVLGRYLTDLDIEYVEASALLGIHDYMLSYVESGSDIQEVRQIDRKATIIYAKIESLPGWNFINSAEFSPFQPFVNILAARDDLVNEIGRRENVFPMLQKMVEIDPQAIVASRLWESLKNDTEVSLSDLSDVYLMKQFGYQNFMLSDGMCDRVEVFSRVMDFLEKYQNEK